MQDIQVIFETLNRLRAIYPANGALEMGTPYHMLALVMMSARTRDEQVLKLAPRFFCAFPTVERLADADLAAITAKVNTVGMYKQKAKHLSAMAKKVVADFGGNIPNTIDELVTLPGVGRKTASVIMVAAFGKPAIAVDTHVFRVVQRLGWLEEEKVKSEKEKVETPRCGVSEVKSPEAVERAMREIVPEQYWADCNHVFVPFGRAVCAPQPRCWMCPVRDLCAYKEKNLEAPKDADAVRAGIARGGSACGTQGDGRESGETQRPSVVGRSRRAVTPRGCEGD